ncbi:MAG TPA: NUDIX hydrolase [Candidatus Saccharimonadales bacterium]|nr:NUDIX hydrolase [Candidatus Saccharimonadales bacterium]
MRLIGAGALFRNPAGEVLLVRPTYKPSWEIPGGIVEEGESPRQCCTRELVEELGCRGTLGRLLVVDWLPDLGGRGDRVLFIFDAGVVADSFVETVTLPAEELSDSQFVDLNHADNYLGPGMVRRLREAIAHAVNQTTGYLEFGWPDVLPIVGPDPRSGAP